MVPLRILVSEDEPFINLLLVEMLEQMGHNVCAAVRTQDDTVAAALTMRPDLLIVDAHLKPGSGVLAVEIILKSVDIPYIFATGDPSIDGPLSPNAILLQKPYREEDLAAAIAKASSNRTAPRLSTKSGLRG